ncbi:hypothetical protein B7463_g7117, partial [Scytalidium lignicola]
MRQVDETEKAILRNSNPNYVGSSSNSNNDQIYNAGYALLNAPLPSTLTATFTYTAGSSILLYTPVLAFPTAGNHNGGSGCTGYNWRAPDAIDQHIDSYLYTQYTSYIGEDGVNNSIVAIWQCDNDTQYAGGMSGVDIKRVIGYIKSEYKGKGCGANLQL